MVTESKVVRPSTNSGSTPPPAVEVNFITKNDYIHHQWKRASTTGGRCHPLQVELARRGVAFANPIRGMKKSELLFLQFWFLQFLFLPTFFEIRHPPWQVLQRVVVETQLARRSLWELFPIKIMYSFKGILVLYVLDDDE